MNKILTAYIFSDGACSGNPGPGGWASIVLLNDLVTELGGKKLQTTNNQMELTGVIEGLKFILSNENKSLVKPEEIIIYSDSSYVLLGATQWINGWKFRGWTNKEGKVISNVDYWQEMNEQLQVAKELKIKLIWKYVRGHTGSPGNERCDEISVEFSQGRIPFLAKALPLSDYSFDLMSLPPDEAIPTTSLLKSKSEKPVTFSYLSKIGSQVIRHKTWADCERRVKGRSGTQFKKAKSAQDEIEIIKSWGLSENHPIESE